MREDWSEGGVEVRSGVREEGNEGVKDWSEEE